VAAREGGKLINRAKVHSPQKRGCLFTDCRPYRPLRTFASSKRCSILYVDFFFCKQNLNRPFFDQVMTYLVKCNFVILAEVQGAVTLLFVEQFQIFQRFKKPCPSSFCKLL
jgi:hypothetical protein